eukprot:PhM_4_TR3856/c0_g1_i1/m.100769
MVTTELFTAQGTRPLSQLMKITAPKLVKREYDKGCRSNVLVLDGATPTQCNVQFTLGANGGDAALSPVLVLQLMAAHGDVLIEVSCIDGSGARRRVTLTHNAKSASEDVFNTRLPLAAMPRDRWCILYIHVGTLMGHHGLKSLERLTLGPKLRLRRIYATKDVLPDGPWADFPPGVDAESMVITHGDEGTPTPSPAPLSKRISDVSEQKKLGAERKGSAAKVAFGRRVPATPSIPGNTPAATPNTSALSDARVGPAVPSSAGRHSSAGHRTTPSQPMTEPISDHPNAAASSSPTQYNPAKYRQGSGAKGAAAGGGGGPSSRPNTTDLPSPFRGHYSPISLQPYEGRVASSSAGSVASPVLHVDSAGAMMSAGDDADFFSAPSNLKSTAKPPAQSSAGDAVPRRGTPADVARLVQTMVKESIESPQHNVRRSHPPPASVASDSPLRASGLLSARTASEDIAEALPAPAVDDAAPLDVPEDTMRSLGATGRSLAHSSTMRSTVNKSIVEDFFCDGVATGTASPDKSNMSSRAFVVQYDGPPPDVLEEEEGHSADDDEDMNNVDSDVDITVVEEHVEEVDKQRVKTETEEAAAGEGHDAAPEPKQPVASDVVNATLAEPSCIEGAADATDVSIPTDDDDDAARVAKKNTQDEVENAASYTHLVDRPSSRYEGVNGVDETDDSADVVPPIHEVSEVTDDIVPGSGGTHDADASMMDDAATGASYVSSAYTGQQYVDSVEVSVSEVARQLHFSTASAKPDVARALMFSHTTLGSVQTSPDVSGVVVAGTQQAPNRRYADNEANNGRSSRVFDHVLGMYYNVRTRTYEVE